MKPIALLTIILLAGCTSPADVATEPGPDPEPTVAAWQTWTLRPDGSLVAAAAVDGAVALDWGYTDWLTGVRPPAWTGAFDGAVRITEGRIHLGFDAVRPSISGDVRPELTAWWGTDTSIQHHVFIDAPDTVTPGQRINGSADLRIPEGGLVVSPERLMLLRVGHYYLDGQALSLRLADTSLELLVEPLAWPAHESETVLDETGTFVGNRCVQDVNVQGLAEALYPVELHAGDGLSVRLVQTEGRTKDIDLAVRGPDGQDVGGGHGSFDVKGADVWWPNTEAAGNGTYTVHVFACTPQVASYHVTATIHRRL